MESTVTYPTVERIIDHNKAVLLLIRVKKADRPEVLGRQKLVDAIEACKNKDGDIYDKAVELLKNLVKKHAFASGNRRTAFVAVGDFLLHNNAAFGVPDDPSQAKVMTGIREGFYADVEIKEWIQYGKIREFKREWKS
ncbi:MAG TPA: Fic family protein, partial [archaeon]|nr:Fic family protein [archaeon]